MATETESQLKDRHIPGQAIPAVVVLCLGSNTPDAARALEQAEAMLRSTAGICALHFSRRLTTAPFDYLHQPDFLNQLASFNVHLHPLALLDRLQLIENLLGRQMTVSKGQRRIDLDILYWSDLTISLPRLVVPHKALYERDFIIRLWPDLKLPVP